MIDTTEVQKVSIGTECWCDDEFECWGYCYEDDLAIVYEVINEWLVANGADEYDTNVAIYTGAMNWNRISGRIVVEVKDIVNALKLNGGDWRVEFRLEGKDLTAVRYSHDEPCGSSFTITLTDEETD